VLVLSAFDHHVRGHTNKAFSCLNAAEDVARQADCPWVLFEAALSRARIFRDLGRDASSVNEAESAVWLAQSLGWSRRAERARALIPAHRRTTSLRGSYAGSSSHDSTRAAATVARTRAQGAALTATRDRDALLEVSLATADELEPVAQAKVALDKLVHVLGAERALFYAWDDAQKQLTVLAARDADGCDLPPDVRVASSLIDRVRRERLPLVLHGTDEGAALGSQSIVAENVRSMICAPVMLRDELLGVVYLDSRLAKGVFTKADLDILLAIANHVAIGQQMARAAQRELERRALERDLELTAAVQMLLLPKQPDADFGHVRMVSLYRPASRSGGDFWGYETLPDGTLRVFLNDVTGHGAGAAMVTSTMAGAYRALTQGKLIAVEPLLAELDCVLDGICAGRFAMTMSVVEIAPSGQTRWWCAGAPPILHAAREGRVSAKAGTGTPLRCGDLTLPVSELTLAEGERLVLFSDAVIEQSMPSGRPVGMRRLMELVAETRALPIEAARDALWSRLVELRDHCDQEDDITFVLIERPGR
jgi:serine phosphatase RsbU (regulator of sigma subunit)